MSKVNKSSGNGNSKLKPPTVEFLRELEKHALEIRKKAGIGPTDKFDPIKRASQLQIQVVPVNEIEGLSPQHLELINRLSPKDWSGSGLSRKLPNGKMLIPVHPKQTFERMNVTILEEVAHDYYGHQPALLNGNGREGYNPAAEQEAYWTAAAALLPMKVVARAVWLGQSAEALGAEFGASRELAEMRIKIMRLWKEYQSRSVNGGG